MMTSKEAESKLCAVAGAAEEEYRAKLRTLPPGAALERQAMKISIGMAEFARKAGVMLGYATETPVETRRKSALHWITDEAERQHILNCPDGEATYLHALVFMERRFLNGYLEDLEKAKKHGEDKMIFKLETQAAALTAILARWREIGREAGFSDAC